MGCAIPCPRFPPGSPKVLGSLRLWLPLTPAVPASSRGSGLSGNEVLAFQEPCLLPFLSGPRQSPLSVSECGGLTTALQVSLLPLPCLVGQQERMGTVGCGRAFSPDLSIAWMSFAGSLLLSDVCACL